MKQDIIINSTTSETRIALLEDKILVELFVERPENERMVGSLYKGVVRKVMAGMSAAFIDIGEPKDAFLHFSDVGAGSVITNILDKGGIDRANIQDHDRQKWIDPARMKVGEPILVQVIKEQIGHKGPRVSSQVTLPGRLMVLVPYESYIGISRKIRDFRETKRLRQIANKLCVTNFGLIIRTVAGNKTEDVLSSDLNRALKTWHRIERDLKKQDSPGLIYRDLTMASTTIRDLFTSDVSSLFVDSRKLFKEIVNYLKDVAPHLANSVKLYTERVPIFDKFGIETEIEKCLSRKIWLSGGGYIYFDATEALVAIDVNSGRFAGKSNHEENALKVNLKAAKEICRQLRLRDVGGIIVIDYIDMIEEKNRKKVLDEMVNAMQADRSKWDIAPLSPFGLMEMTRQRVRPSLLYTFREPCPNCDGTGLVSSIETVVTIIERWIKRFTSNTRERRLILSVHPRIKAYLTGGLTSRIARVMWANRVFITLNEDEMLKLEEFRTYSVKQKKDVTEYYMASSFNQKDRDDLK